MISLPPFEFVSELLEVCQASPSGLIWKVARTNRVKQGSFAGNKKPNGYYQICITYQNKSRAYYTHRIVFLLQHQQDPGALQIDHVVNKQDNCELRLATAQQNCFYRNKRNKASSQYKGVGWHKRDQVWTSAITKDQVNYHLGYFTNEKEAAQAYDKAAKKMFKEFARLNFTD